MKRLNLPQERTFTGPALIWKRVAAFFIDILVLNLTVLFPFRKFFQNLIPKGSSFSETYNYLRSSTNFTTYATVISFVMSILIIMYFFMLEKRMGQTIGKMLMKIYVVSDNEVTKPWQFLVRDLAFLPIFPFVLLWAADPLFMFFTKSNQRLTEILSKTKVVELYSLEPKAYNII